ncbi:MAG: SRPBCC domain-containing protein [Flavobacteriaceae bacterium]|jgi:uncharacterized protein YndB with AHSA1/START domain|nr:SRPBCC domain-containing protein [Flavobacteriaceae bacterium]|tara:strand:+ start:1345 stop:1725 length:381 start_codon:yes stop_codon:yes gene_type:complete
MSTKKQYTIEYDFHASPQLLFQYLSTPSGLSEWFADNVNSRGEDFTFLWDDSEEEAKLLSLKADKTIRFQWKEDQDSFFQFEIVVDEITKDVSLLVTDFAEEDEIEESQMLWNNLIADLKQVLGST